MERLIIRVTDGEVLSNNVINIMEYNGCDSIT